MDLHKRIEKLEHQAGDHGQRVIVHDIAAETGEARYFVNGVQQPGQPEQRPGDVVIRFGGTIQWSDI